MTSFIARTPVDLLAVVPFALGFHPDDSVVLLTFGRAEEAGPGAFHARVDLPVGIAEQEEVAHLLHDLALRHRADRIGLLLYTEDAEASRSLHDLLVPRFEADGIEVVDALRIDGDRFHVADDPEDPGITFDLSSHPFTAAQVVEGRMVHDNREALADSLVGHDENDREEIVGAADRIADRLIAAGRRNVARRSGNPARRARGTAGSRPPLAVALADELRLQARWLQRELRRSVDRPGGVITAADAARMLVLVALEALREVAMAEMTRPTSAFHLEVWRDLTRRAPADLRAAPAALCAFAAWLHGDGALAWCALDRCFEADPDDSLGHQVAALLESATPPGVWSPTGAESLWLFGGEAGSGSGRRRALLDGPEAP